MSNIELPELIGLYSPAPQSGKSTAAKYLKACHNYETHSFAEPLKAMVYSLLCRAGYFRDQAQAMLYGADKEKPIPELGGKTTRHLLQTLGTEWGRGMVCDSIWTELAIKNAKEVLPVVFDDMRFLNEMQAVRDAGGACICIVRPGTQHATTHASEGALNRDPFDAYIVNSGTVEELHAKIDAALQEIARKRQAAKSRPPVAESATPRGGRESLPSGYGDLAELFGDVSFSSGHRNSVFGESRQSRRCLKPNFEITGPGIYRLRNGSAAEIIEKALGLASQRLWRGRLCGCGQSCLWLTDGAWGYSDWEHDLDIVQGPL